MFYKLDGEALISGSHISGDGFDLLEAEKDSYAYPIEGWHWFNSDAEANTFFRIVNK